jgi:magnesium and cobalt exporter, CNNM family
MTIIWRVLLIAALVSLNGFFAASEYSLLSVRRTRLEQLARQGNVHARLALRLLSDIGLLISGTLLGMAVVSLLMGWLGEEMVSSTIEQLLEGRLTGFISVAAVHLASTGIAFLIITGLLIVLGELVPKAVAYDRSDRVALIVARPMAVFLQLTRYPVLGLDAASDTILRLLGYKPTEGHGPAHTPEEVKLIVAAIRKRGLLDREQEEMIRSVFDLQRVRVREIMVPWPKVIRLPLTSDLGTILVRIVESQHSRIPLYEKSPDHIVGILYSKDLLDLALNRMRNKIPLEEPIDLRPMLHEPTIIPEAMPLNQILEELRRQRVQVALVVDEFGTFVGLVTIEDVLEQIVGEMGDEFRRKQKTIQKVGDDVLVLDGALSLRDLAQDYEIQLPRDAGYETLAGFMLAQLGSIPQGGEGFVFEGRRFTVSEMDGRRVAKVKIEKLPWVGTQARRAVLTQPRTPAQKLPT